jgi:2,3-bisphosphoglycerate-independent phosphoglycerate mutase
VVEEGGKPVGEIHDGDAVLFCNFRGDRAIEISRAFDEPASPSWTYFDRERVPAVRYSGLMSYDGKLFQHYSDTILTLYRHYFILTLF